MRERKKERNRERGREKEREREKERDELILWIENAFTLTVFIAQ